MQDVSHLKLMAMSLLQTCHYVTEQMQTPVRINVNKFLESFSIQTEEGDFHPPSWIAGKDNSVSFSPAIIPNSETSSLTPPSPPPSPSQFTMDEYTRSRQAEAISWINLQEKRASIIARLQPATPEDYQAHRDAITSQSGPLRRKGMNFHYSLRRRIYQVFIYLAPKRTIQLPKSKIETNTRKFLKNPMDLLTQRQFFLNICACSNT
jgi:hypothetical protein